MLSGAKFLAGVFRSDFARLRRRVVTSAIFYGVAGLAFVAAVFLGGAAGTVALVERFGVAEGLALSGVAVALVGGVALAIQSILSRRTRYRARLAAQRRSEALAEVADDGLRRTREAIPATLPAVAALSFALTTMLLRQSKR
jgi:hypothetical protein